MIFEEPTGRRRRQAQRCLIALIGFLALLLAVACLNALISPSLPKLAESSPTHRHATIVSEPLGKNEPVLPGPSTPPANIATSAIATTPAPATAASSHSLFSSPFVRCAFVVNDDPESVSDLIDHLPEVQVVFPDFFTFSTDDGAINTKPNDALVGKLLAAGVTIIPRISNTDASGNWKSDILREIFTSSSATDQFIDQLIAGLAKVHARGVNLDIESIDVGEKRNFVNWLDTLAAALHQKQLALTVDVPAFDDAFDYEAIGSIADAVVLMAYDQHYATGRPGPIAGKQWFSDCVDDGVSRIDPSKLIMGMGAYGYDWTRGKKGAEALGFSDAMLLAQQNGAEVQTDKEAVNSYFKYQDDSGRSHDVWLLDAVSCWNQYVAASRARSGSSPVADGS
jgi:spore germination protein YaaH